MFDIKQFIYPALEIAAIKNSFLNNFKMLLLRQTLVNPHRVMFRFPRSLYSSRNRYSDILRNLKNIKDVLWSH